MCATNIPVIDVRGLKCPIPFQMASEKAMTLAAGESFLLHINVKPQPLFDYLEQHNFDIELEPLPEGGFMVKITAREDSLHQSGEVVSAPRQCKTSRSTG